MTTWESARHGSAGLQTRLRAPYCRRLLIHGTTMDRRIVDNLSSRSRLFASTAPCLTDSRAVISYTQAPTKRELGRKERCHGGMSSFQRNSGHDSRAACTAARQTAGKHGVASRGATLLTLTIEPLRAPSCTALRRRLTSGV
jgi:hypothetical protein